MSYFIVYDVFVNILKLKGGNLLVYSAIYSAVAHMNGIISVPQIAGQTGLLECSIYKILNVLESRGLIKREGSGPHGKNRYSLSGVRVGERGHPVISDEEDSSPLKSSPLKSKPIKSSGGDRNFIGEVSIFETVTPRENRLPIVSKL